MTTGLVVIATGRYTSFVPAFTDNARRYVNDLTRIFVLSENPEIGRAAPDVEWLPWGHLPWPYPTLLRYHAMVAYRQRLETVDRLVYMDVDMRIEQACDFSTIDGIFAVRHPGYLDARPAGLPFERRPESQLYWQPTASSTYLCGAVQGGAATAYLDASRQMSVWIDADLANGLIPVWHDESAWNRWCAEHTPDLVLPHTYCWPQWKTGDTPIIVALDKNHAYFRAASARQAMIARVRPCASATRRLLRRAVRKSRRIVSDLRRPRSA